jgi:hypothetical protein
MIAKEDFTLPAVHYDALHRTTALLAVRARSPASWNMTL